MIFDNSEYKWECPQCGDVLYGHGPASLSWARSNHEYQHDREAKGLSPAPYGGFASGGNIPEVFKPEYALHYASIPFDEAFYDGARLSAFDRGFFRALKVLWVPNSKQLTA